MPVISATQEAEAGELPEYRRRRVRWAEIVPLHTSLGNKSETLFQKKKKKEKGCQTFTYQVKEIILERLIFELNLEVLAVVFQLDKGMEPSNQR